MPYFEVLIHGSGIAIPADDDGEAIVGFFTSCVIFADDAESAARRGIGLVAAQWEAATRYGRTNRGGKPSLAVDEVHALSWWTGFRSRKQTRYSFYVAGGDADDEADGRSPV